MDVSHSDRARPQPDGQGLLRDYLAALLGNDGRLIVASPCGPFAPTPGRPTTAWSPIRCSGSCSTSSTTCPTNRRSTSGSSPRGSAATESATRSWPTPSSSMPTTGPGGRWGCSRTTTSIWPPRASAARGPRRVVGPDRLEPAKNALRGFVAFESLLKRRPELRRSVRFLAIASLSRADVEDYARYAAAVREVVARVNGMADPDQAPIWLLDGSDYELAIAALSLADGVLVNPVVDGMNLGCQEAALVSRAALVL